MVEIVITKHTCLACGYSTKSDRLSLKHQCSRDPLFDRSALVLQPEIIGGIHITGKMDEVGLFDVPG